MRARSSLVPRPSLPSVCRLLVLQATNAGARRPGYEARLGEGRAYLNQFPGTIGFMLPLKEMKVTLL